MSCQKHFHLQGIYLLMYMLSLFYFQGVIIGVTPNYLVALRSYQVPGGLPGVIFCKVVGSSYFVFVLGKVSCLTVTCLALERWYSVVKPIKYRLTFKRQRERLKITTKIKQKHLPFTMKKLLIEDGVVLG